MKPEEDPEKFSVKEGLFTAKKILEKSVKLPGTKLPSIVSLDHQIVDPNQISSARAKTENTPDEIVPRFDFKYYKDRIMIEQMQKKVDMAKKHAKHEIGIKDEKAKPSLEIRRLIPEATSKNIRKKQKKNASCVHRERKHYALGLCRRCYDEKFKS